ncbi:MAG: ribonuclease Z [Pirellulales bacterium]|nr:ribonuclease Z [Pirellulales bacterium]
MLLHLLGTTGYHPSDARQTACLMLPEIGVVLDAGTAMYRVRDHLETDVLDIFLTHAHLDHCIGLTYLFDVLEGHDIQRVTVHAEKDKLAAIQDHLLNELLFPAHPPCTFEPLSNGTSPLPKGGKLIHFPLQHPGGAVGYRLDWSCSSMAYVSDTSSDDHSDYVETIRGVDLLVHECHFDDSRMDQAELTGHSCVSSVCHLAARAEVGLLVLVHINPLGDQKNPFNIEAAKTIFPSTIVGEDRMVIEF